MLSKVKHSLLRGHPAYVVEPAGPRGHIHPDYLHYTFIHLFNLDRFAHPSLVQDLLLHNC